MPGSVRIDKWLWAVRVFKTRPLAIEAFRGGHVKIEGQAVKPARDVRLGETISATIGPVTKTVKVLGLIDKRVGAAAAKEFAEDLTPPSEYAKAREPVYQPLLNRPKGMGRPTKKDRRAMEKFGME
jgi:ribosome-associated heat shock protein Hsp15